MIRILTTINRLWQHPPMIKIYGSPRSSASRVYWLLEEIGLTYQPVKINMREKEHKSEAFLKLNSNGKIPVLTDGDFVIWESIAINNYLADKYAPHLLGSTPEIRGTVSQWNIWSMLELQKPMIDIFIQKVFVPEDRRDLALIEKAQKSCPPLLGILDNALNKHKYLAGDTFTVADLNMASVVTLATPIGMDISAYKNIQGWLSAVMERPSFQKFSKLE